MLDHVNHISLISTVFETMNTLIALFTMPRFAELGNWFPCEHVVIIGFVILVTFLYRVRLASIELVCKI